MEGKILATSKCCSFRKILIVLAILSVVIPLLTWIIASTRMYPLYLEDLEKCNNGDYWSGGRGTGFMTPFEYYFLNEYFVFDKYGKPFTYLIIPVIALFAFVLITYIVNKKNEIVVTPYRVYGTTIFGKRVDIPVDSISAVAQMPLIKGITVVSSAGGIKFPFMNKASELFAVINNLLTNRQNAMVKLTSSAQVSSQSNADEIKQYKELLDGGVITQEEFDAKKKQLLSL